MKAPRRKVHVAAKQKPPGSQGLAKPRALAEFGEPPRKADLAAYLRSWADELDARANRVRQLIGDAHWLSDGQHKEALIREFLRRYLPPGLLVSRGFVISPNFRHRCSPEIDILVIDPSAHPAFFAEGDLQIVAPTSMVAHIQVKTTFTSPNLADALSNIAATQLTVGSYAKPEQVWRCVYFFQVPASRDQKSIMSTVRREVVRTATKLRATITALSDKESSLSALLPTCIATPSSIVFVSQGPNNSITLKLFALDKLCCALALADLFGEVRHWFGRTVPGELDDVIESLAASKPLTLSLTL